MNVGELKEILANYPDDMEFKCFNDADFTDIKFEELKAMIKNEIINQKPVDNIPVI